MNSNKWYKVMIINLIFVALFFVLDPVYAISCDGILTQEAADFLGKIMGWIRIIAPILLIIFGSIDFATVVFTDDKDNMKKAISKFVKRCIAAVAIFFVPLIVGVLLDISGIAGTIVDDPMCGIEEVGD